MLPSVATASAGQARSACSLSTANSAASELIGTRVEARKLAPNSDARLAEVPIKPGLRPARAGMRPTGTFPSSGIETFGRLAAAKHILLP